MAQSGAQRSREEAGIASSVPCAAVQGTKGETVKGTLKVIWGFMRLYKGYIKSYIGY